MAICDQDPHNDKRRAIEQLLGDASLTNDLVDEAAKLLLDWATAQLDDAFQPNKDVSRVELSARVSRLRRLMKCVSRRAGRAPVDQQGERVRRLLSQLGETGDIEADGSSQ